MESFRDNLGMLNTDLILAYYKLHFWKIFPILGNKLGFIFFWLNWKQIKSSSHISELGLLFPPLWNYKFRTLP